MPSFTLLVNGRTFTVVGIMPPGFQFPIQAEPIDLYITTAIDAVSQDGTKPETERRGDHSMFAIARLKASATSPQAETDLSAIAARLNNAAAISGSTRRGSALRHRNGRHRRSC